MYSPIKTPQEISRLRISAHILYSTLQKLHREAHIGMPTREFDRIAALELKAAGATAPFLGYQGFPATICVSVNNEVVHGIPGERILEEGDIVGLDFGANFEGMISDGAITIGIGDITPAAQRLLTATSEALTAGIGQVRDGIRVGDISAAIEHRLRRDKLGIIEDLSGHGVGHELHEEPLIAIMNFGKAGRGPKLVAGMTIAIEPMATLGTKHIMVAQDDWTILTTDGSLGAQFEHTVLVTEDGFEILTQ
jgi:methionyl aminopeptidase